MRYRKRPVEIEAIHFDGDNVDEVLNFLGVTCDRVPQNNVVITTLEGDMMALPGDWIIRGIKGEYYPCKPDVFEQTYEAVEGSTDDVASWGWDAGVASQEAS